MAAPTFRISGQLAVAAMAVLAAVAYYCSSLVCWVTFGDVVGLNLAVAAMAILDVDNHKQLITPTFSNNPSDDAYLCLNKRVKDIIELNCEHILAVLLLLWRELQGILIDCIPYCLSLCSKPPDILSYHLSFYSHQGLPLTSGDRVIQG